MTATITAYGRLLEASADDRTLTYRLLPYGEPGNTSLGRVTASAGVVTLPPSPDALVANLEHDSKRPVARATRFDEEDEGLVASFRIAATSTGNDLLAEATEGLRTGISVELADTVIRDGKLLGGRLTGAGFVTEPAFPSAQLVAADTDTDEVDAAVEQREIVIDGVTYRRVEPDDEDTTGPTDEEETEAEAAEDTDTEDDTTEDAESEDDEEEDTVTASTKAASAPADLRASAASGGGRLTANSHPVDLFRMLADIGNTHDPKLTAALVDITQTGAIGNTEVPQWVGELWDGRAIERRIVPLFNSAALTAYKVNGWRWAVKPTVATYTGDKAAVPSNAASTEPVEITAERIAGAHDIDRKYRDFGDQGFWQSYIQAMVESYAVVSDAQVMADVYAAATPVEVGTIPSNVPAVWAKIVDGVTSVLDATNAMPGAAILSKQLYREFLLTPQEGGLEYLNASLGFEDGTVTGFRVVPHSTLAADEALVAARDAVTVHELSSTPIRVEAQNIANGGIDVGVFGYYAVNVHDTGGLALVGDPVA